jgi:hypothetical protein
MSEQSEAPFDPDFTDGLRSEVYLELLREGLIDGSAHHEIKAKDATIAEQAERIVTLEARNERLREKYRSGYSSGFSSGYLQAEFDCEAMGAEAFLRQADGLRQSQGSILNQQYARIAALESALEEAGQVLAVFGEEAANWIDGDTFHELVVEHFDAEEYNQSAFRILDLRNAGDVSKRIMDLCHASPEQADGSVSPDKPALQAGDDREAERAELLLALKDARDDIESWGAYATDYFQDKWDLEGCIKRYDDLLAKYSFSQIEERSDEGDQQGTGEA